MQGANTLIRTIRSWHKGLDSINMITINTILETKTYFKGGISMNKGRSYRIQNIWLWYYLKEVLILTLNRVYWDSSRFDRVRYSVGYVEKKGNLLGSVVGLIVWVRLLSRHTTVETLGWWNDPTQVDLHWQVGNTKRVSSRVEQYKYWVNRMFDPIYKIIPYNKFIHL